MTCSGHQPIARLVVLCLLTLPGPARAKDPAVKAGGPRPGPTAEQLGAQDLTDVLEPIRRVHELPALVALVITNKKILAAGAVGVRRAEGRKRVGLQDRFLLGSCTKSMTATICACLVEQGKLRWNQTIRETFPELADRIRPDYHDVTLAQLLCHRSGLPDDRSPTAMRVRLRLLHGDIRKQRRQAVALGLAQEPAGRPDTAFIYSNMGFLIAGAMAEQAAGQSWEQLARDLLFDPLDMKNAGFGSPGEADAVNQPWGHQTLFGSLRRIPPGPLADTPPVLAPALSVHCSLLDWARYARLHLSAGRGDARLLKVDTFNTLHTDTYKQGYAFGWAVANPAWARGQVLRHAGSNGRWFARITIAPQRNLAFLVATNRDAPEGVEAAYDALVRRFAK